jgi:hypothetical protein
MLPLLATLSAAASFPAEQAIGLTVALDRPAGAYAIGDTISLTVSASRAAAVRVWLREPSGTLTPVFPDSPRGEAVHLQAGQRIRLPRTGALRITPPAGRYEFLVTATSEAGGSRSITDADSRLAGRDVREQRTIPFTVEQI